MKIDIDGDTVSNIVVQDLKGYHEIMKDNPEEDGICVAIERVLVDYMSKDEYNNWYRSVNKEIDFGKDVGKEVIDE
jgi:hypothetical protein